MSRSTLLDIDTPTAVVDLDRLESNITTMANIVRTSGKTLRPHTKTHKSPIIAYMQMSHGACGLTVAKLGEAEVMQAAGFSDLFIANQIVGDLKIGRLLQLVDNALVTVGVDSIESSIPIADAAAQRGASINVMVEVDTGLGRAGVRSIEEAINLVRVIAEHKGISFAGIFTHEGHLYRELGDGLRPAASDVANKMRDTAAAIHARTGIECRTVSVGSTPGVRALADQSGIHEMRPGVYVFNDRMQVARGASPESLALTILATVVSVRSDGAIIVDAGSKSLAGDTPFDDKTFGELLDHPDVKVRAVSEEHGILQAGHGHAFKVGDRVRIVPNHACTCVNMHDTLTFVRQDTVEEIVPVSGRGKIR